MINQTKTIFNIGVAIVLSVTANSLYASSNTIKNMGRCLDVSQAISKNGQNVQIWDCNNTIAQQWKLQ
jgi:hypothetical protein